MSDIMSFMDDFVGIEDRMPKGDHDPPNIAAWLGFNNYNYDAWSDDRSYYDDGADLLPPTPGRAGFGKPNPEFYAKRTRKPVSIHYHPDVEKAVSADIRNTLENYYAVTKNLKIEVGGDEGEKENKTVTVWVPPRMPDFLIKGNNGEVIIVDGTEEPIDSRPAPRMRPPSMRERERKLEPVPESIRPKSLTFANMVKPIPRPRRTQKPQDNQSKQGSGYVGTSGKDKSDHKASLSHHVSPHESPHESPHFEERSSAHAGTSRKEKSDHKSSRSHRSSKEHQHKEKSKYVELPPWTFEDIVTKPKTVNDVPEDYFMSGGLGFPSPKGSVKSSSKASTVKKVDDLDDGNGVFWDKAGSGGGPRAKSSNGGSSQAKSGSGYASPDKKSKAGGSWVGSGKVGAAWNNDNGWDAWNDSGNGGNDEPKAGTGQGSRNNAGDGDSWNKDGGGGGSWNNNGSGGSHRSGSKHGGNSWSPQDSRGSHHSRSKNGGDPWKDHGGAGSHRSGSKPGGGSWNNDGDGGSTRSGGKHGSNSWKNNGSGGSHRSDNKLGGGFWNNDGSGRSHDSGNKNGGNACDGRGGSNRSGSKHSHQSNRWCSPEQPSSVMAPSLRSSNYKLPTVETLPPTPGELSHNTTPKKRVSKNGYDDESYCNANWGGIPVRVADWKTQ